MSNPPKTPGAFPAHAEPSTRLPGTPALSRNHAFDPSPWSEDERDLPQHMQEWLGHLRAGRLHAEPDAEPPAPDDPPA